MKHVIISKAGLFALAFGCFILFSFPTNVITGQTVKESRIVSAFNGVALAFSGDVFISQGSQQKVEIEAEKSTLEIIVTEIDGNTLILKTKKGIWRNLGEINVYITMPEVKSLSVSGSGDMVCETSLRAPEIKLNVSGSGSLKIHKLESPDVSAIITGSGDIKLAGTANDQCQLDAMITGSGSFNAEELLVGIADINITGSGSARVNVLKELETNITGSGNVQYKGNPMVNANTTGSGKTRSVN